MLLTAVTIILWVLSAFVLLRTQLPFFNLLLLASIAFVLGNALLSITYVLMFFANLPFAALIAFVLLLPIVFLILKRKQLNTVFKLHNTLTISTTTLVLLLLLLYRFSSDFLSQSTIWGSWDAWAIWSLHAKFLINHEHFNLLFSGAIEGTHPDYPLMLPGLIALYWKLLGQINPYVPLFIAYGTSISLMLICSSAFIQQKRAALGLIIVFILIKQDVLLPFGAMQYADTLLALFFLLSLMLYQLSTEHEEPLLTLLTGFFAASCGWIKNEGLMFFLIFTLLFLFVSFRKKEKILLYILGVSLPLFIIFYFKLHFEASSDLFTKKNNDIPQKIFDFDRYKEIWDFMYDYLTKNNQIILYCLLVAIFLNRRYFKSFSFIVLSSVFAGYFFIYVITPVNLNWHLSTSFDRLLHQISPAIIYTIALSISKGNKKLEL